MKILKLSYLLLLICGLTELVLGSEAYAADRKKRIDFEDTLVEGVNRQPLDSLSQVSDELNHNKPRLYRKRGGFRDLIPETLDEMRLVK